MELFDITDDEVTRLKTIITKEEAAERHRERNRKQVDRAAYLETIKETAEQRRAQARLLRAKGLSWKEVGENMNISATAARLLALR